MYKAIMPAPHGLGQMYFKKMRLVKIHLTNISYNAKALLLTQAQLELGTATKLKPQTL
jgi:hypothetical protein